MLYSFLGQSGILLQLAGLQIIIDPYLFDSVFEKYGPKFKRQFILPLESINFSKIDYVFITHAHLDHADPASIDKLVRSNPNIHIICPESVYSVLKKNKNIRKQLNVLESNILKLNDTLKVNIIPAAHLELSFTKNGIPENVGYLFQSFNKIIYHSGDTIPHSEIISAISSIGCPDLAFLPCNERNYYREKLGIVGNMSIREMFQFAMDIGAKRICPIHWDMFALNSAFPEEIRLLHKLLNHQINLTIPEHGCWYQI